MKKEKLEEIRTVIQKSRKEPVNRNDKFWVDSIETLVSSTRAGLYQDFLTSWIKEVVNILKDEAKANVLLVMPNDGSLGIRVASKEDYIFSYNEKADIYIGYRLYKYLKEKKLYSFMAALLLYEMSEFLMRCKAEKKDQVVDASKNRGEAMRLEKAFLGKGNKCETPLRDLLLELAEVDLNRKKVIVDKSDVFVEHCEVKGEEIVAEITAFDRNESFIVELAPGEIKPVPYSAGVFTVRAEDFVGVESEQIEFSDYCSLMRMIDDYFIEESVIYPEGPFAELLSYIKNLDFFDTKHNSILRLLWIFGKKYFHKKASRHEFLYNIFLIIDEYVSYSVFSDLVKDQCWKQGKFVKDNLKMLSESGLPKKTDELPEGFYSIKAEKDKIRKTLMAWFSRMDEKPMFFKIEDLEFFQCVPKFISSYYAAAKDRSLVLSGDNDIESELVIHKDILIISRVVSSLKQEGRWYRGIEKGEDERVCELNMLRVHFWMENNLLNTGDKIRIYANDNKGFGLAEVIEIKSNSIVVFLDSVDVSPPESGYVKKLEEEDASLDVSLAAIQQLKMHTAVYNKFIIKKDKELVAGPSREIKFFNTDISKDLSQSFAVESGVFGQGATLIQGPPGTGKTTVIAEIVLQFLAMGKRVLLCAQTHNAVDNALKEIIKTKNPGVGAGRVASTQEKITDPILKNIWIRSGRDLEEFERINHFGYVIGVTNVGSHTLNIMKGREFDVLVMDEAGKANLIESLLPILLLKENGKLVLVGDHKQGNPFAYNDDIVNLFLKKQMEIYGDASAIEQHIAVFRKKINQSLFERIIEKGYESILLKVNYRSTPDIVNLVSSLFYDNQIVSFKPPLDRAKSVIVVDTSKKTDIESRKETEVFVEGEAKGYKNIYEAKLVAEELKEFLKYKYASTGIRIRKITDITILAPYIFQVEEIRKQISIGLAGKIPHTAIEDILDNVSTIDSFQGREDEVVIISFTRSNDNPYEVGFLRELNRINVALSRAKRKMVLIGDFETLSNVKKGQNSAYIREIFKKIRNSVY
jgi:superfamily I DNA and/or RNA helicase